MGIDIIFISIFYFTHQEGNCEMNELFSKNYKRCRAESTFARESAFYTDGLPLKLCKTTSGQSMVEVINLDDLPEKSEKSNARMSKTATQQQYLYCKLKDDAKKCCKENMNWNRRRNLFP